MRKSLAPPLILLLFALLLLPACHLSDRSGSEDVPAPSYTIDATLDAANKRLEVETSLTFSLPTDDLDTVKLRLFAAAYATSVVSPTRTRDAYPAGMSYGDCEVTELSADRAIENYIVDEDDPTVLLVRLAAPASRGDEITLRMHTRVTLANVKHRLGYTGDTYTLSGFYPELCPFLAGAYRADPYYPYGDPFCRETAHFDVTLRYPVPYVAAASAPIAERTREGARYVSHFITSDAREFAAVLSPDLSVKERSLGERTIRYYYESDPKAADTLDFIEEALLTFARAFGDCPYPSYSIVLAPFFEAGMEYSGLALVSDALSAAERKRAILHETAHQWWHGKVGSDETLHPWMDEATAEYAVAYYYRSHDMLYPYRDMLSAATDDYAVYAAVHGDEAVDRPLSKGETGYYEVTYKKGLLMLTSLAEIVGYDALNAALSDYATRFARRIATPEDYISSLARSLGESADALLRRWLYTPLPIE